MGAAVWKQPTGGDDPVLLATNAASALISPDGEHVAIVVWRDDDDGPFQNFLEIIPSEGGAPVISIDVKQSIRGLRWRPDGQALTYVDNVDGQVWRQPLDGGPPEQLTHFDTGRTISHAWSPDGRWLYLVREENTRDAVLIRDF
jgi:Tol biopolymer transport system component